MLGVMGTLASRFIGILYLNKKDPNQLRIAHLSFFGSRIDKVVPVNFFIPITDTSENLGDSYVVLQTVDQEQTSKSPSFLDEILPKQKYYISLRHGTVLDEDAFMSIFGDVSQYLLKKK